MTVGSLNPGDVTGGHVKIGAQSHWLRNLTLGIAIAAAGASFWAYSRYSSGKDAATLAGFDAFRALYAEKCNVPAYAGPAPAMVRDAYLTSPPIREAVDKQAGALQNGATCESVAKALKAADFVVPAPVPAQ
jgi:hypothetical protein